MPKSLGYFFLIVTFIVGLSVGFYSSEVYHGKEQENIDSITNMNISKSVQDTVLERVQSDEFWTNNSTNDNANITLGQIKSGDEGDIIEVFVGEEKISPGAKLIIKKIFSKCSHSTVSITEVPKELINLSERELAKKYTGWNIEKFSSDEIIISREIDANCEDHYVLKEKDGIVSIYNELTEDKMNFIEKVDVDLELLGEAEKERLKEGIRVYGSSELGSLLEDYAHERRSNLKSGKEQVAGRFLIMHLLATCSFFQF
ncbi:MAG: BofC C-terminal domain-containing protein [Clostridia bacterium]|nr:BofC C-terminal domain-containing protein [Clostridia bacterium]